jgi:formate hydrogenlyase subunit 4
MIHEVMILDNSGFDKALIHIGSYLRFAIFGALMYNVIVPAGWNIYLQIALFLTVQAVFAIIIGLIESFRARNKMNLNPKFILTLSAIAWIAFMIILILTDKLI